MHKMKLKRYVTETEWHSLSNFIRYLWSSPNYDFGLCIWSWTWTPSTEIQPQKIKTISFFNVTREEDPIKIQRESDTNRRTLDTSIQSLETLEPWKDKVENVSFDWRKDTSTHSVAVTQHAGFPWSFRGQIPRSRVQASSNVLLQRMNNNNNLNEIQLDFHSQILTIIQNNFMDALQCPNLKETHFER